MGKDCERTDCLILDQTTASFSTELSPHSVDMTETAENSMTVHPIDPAIDPAACKSITIRSGSESRNVE